ncbi:MAG: hypothetical protein H0W73_14760 [Bacteroidetes bacterium]|nr:hypothetical protein [Bacteroidota bacterium]
MKTFIYLPLIALIILTGCKSNSFTTQRYTKFGHASHKRSLNEREIVKAKQSQPKEIEVKAETGTVVVKENRTPIGLITAGVATLKDVMLKPERKVYDLHSTTLENAPSSVSSNETITDDLKPALKSDKAFKSKMKKDDGFIGSAFMTALWIILVVIFILLIIFLLSAVF